MLTADGKIETERASKYLVQLCRHLSHPGGHLAKLAGHHMTAALRHRGGMDHGEVAALAGHTKVEWTPDRGVITFGWRARCELLAQDGSLVLRLEAEDTAGLQRAQEAISRNVERLGQREELRLSWNPPVS